MPRASPPGAPPRGRLVAMPLRATTSPEEWEEGGFSFYRIGTEDELAAADRAIDELVGRTLEHAARMAEARGVQLAELLHETGNRLAERAIELLREEPPLEISRRQMRRIRRALTEQAEGEAET
jgi:hypothetical protein